MHCIERLVYATRVRVLIMRTWMGSRFSKSLTTSKRLLLYGSIISAKHGASIIYTTLLQRWSYRSWHSRKYPRNIQEISKHPSHDSSTKTRDVYVALALLELFIECRYPCAGKAKIGPGRLMADTEAMLGRGGEAVQAPPPCWLLDTAVSCVSG